MDNYWKQFMHTVDWDRMPKVDGTLEARNSDGNPNDPYPVIVIRTDNGYKLRVNVTHVRLLSELVRLRPDIGDRITITYRGEAEKAAPGTSPAREFDVVVIRKGSHPPAGTDQVSGKAMTGERPGGGT